MVDPVTTRRALFRGIFFLLCGTLIFYKMLPLSTLPSSIPSPDLLFIFTAAWIMRRPNFAPVWLIVPLHLLTDLLFMRPPGLWAAVSLLGYEFLRSKRLGSSEISIVGELLMIAGTFLAMFFSYTLVLLVFGVPTAGLWPVALHIMITIAVYPLAILATHFIFRVRRLRPGDIDDDGAFA